MDADTINLTCDDAMSKAIDYLKHELRGLRTGRASTALVEYVKVDYYGSPTDLKGLAAISTPEPALIVIKPFDPTSVGAITKGIQASDLGLNPQSDGKTIRITIPPLSGDRRKQLISKVKEMGESAKVSVRNARRDANKHVDQAEKAHEEGMTEDAAKDLKEEILDMTHDYEKKIDELVKVKSDEINEV
ncbi:MAG: ribosome recycling factor [Phycisphaerales bacterium]|nr:ribosome recycling factor [Phycisphaerales bacterium]